MLVMVCAAVVVIVCVFACFACELFCVVAKPCLFYGVLCVCVCAVVVDAFVCFICDLLFDGVWCVYVVCLVFVCVVFVIACDVS